MEYNPEDPLTSTEVIQGIPEDFDLEEAKQVIKHFSWLLMYLITRLEYAYTYKYMFIYSLDLYLFVFLKQKFKVSYIVLPPVILIPSHTLDWGSESRTLIFLLLNHYITLVLD